MKTTDFMVGDWLRTSRGNAKVIAVDKIGLTFKIDGGDFDIDKDDEEEWFCPIPLTQEILQKNGWEEKKEQEPFIYYSLKDEKNYISISQEWDGTLEMPYWSLYIGSYLSDATLSIEYVHELQHALKLCGIEKEIEL